MRAAVFYRDERAAAAPRPADLLGVPDAPQPCTRTKSPNASFVSGQNPPASRGEADLETGPFAQRA